MTFALIAAQEIADAFTYSLPVLLAGGLWWLFLHPSAGPSDAYPRHHGPRRFREDTQ